MKTTITIIEVSNGYVLTIRNGDGLAAMESQQVFTDFAGLRAAVLSRVDWYAVKPIEPKEAV